MPSPCFFSFASTRWVNLIVLVIGLGAALFYIIQKHFRFYKRGQITQLKIVRNILLDILGLLFTIAAASYLGGLAGTRLGTSHGMWAGLIAGLVFAFLAAWSVRKLWVKVSARLMS